MPNKEAGFRCFRCHEFVRANFQHVNPVGPNDGYHWLGICPKCKTPNYLKKPSWDRAEEVDRALRANMPQK